MSLRTQMYNCVFGIFVFGLATRSFLQQEEPALAAVFGTLLALFLVLGVVTGVRLARAQRRQL